MKKGLVIVAFILLLLMLAAFPILATVYSVASVARDEPVVGRSTGAVVVREVQAKGKHYITYTEGGQLYLKDVGSNSSAWLRKASGKTRAAMTRLQGKPASVYDYLPDTRLVDPVSLKIGIQPSIPYTYDATLPQAFDYLETVLHDGWQLRGYYSDPDYLDYYVSKDNILSRIVILHGSIKVFHHLGGAIPDPRLFAEE